MRECENCFYAISINDDRDIFCVCVENKGKRLRNDCELQSGCDYFRAAWSIPPMQTEEKETDSARLVALAASAPSAEKGV